MRYRSLKVSVPEQIVEKPVKDDLVIVDLHRGEYYSLNETGRAVWELLGEVADVDELVVRLAERFPGDSSAIRDDVEMLLDELLDRKLLSSDAI